MLNNETKWIKYIFQVELSKNQKTYNIFKRAFFLSSYIIWFKITVFSLVLQCLKLNWIMVSLAENAYCQKKLNFRGKSGKFIFATFTN
ncbi:hypothetical protein BpHYR1_021028 [Brachionus plicatilis]|uniref:Uncharacterized protein n=1 Tax=Brachionus plicatilis TaxID=10195 RepID=A0A3M7SGU9_BRAPC|nr:hypothetical protein BpHYR1_021028 [Brachionus plicatilis]